MSCSKQTVSIEDICKDKHIQDIWTVYEPIKKILEKLERFKLW